MQFLWQCAIQVQGIEAPLELELPDSTGQCPPPPVKPRTQVPGKLNMGDFHKVSAAVTGLKLESPGASPGSAGSGSRKGGGKGGRE